MEFLFEPELLTLIPITIGLVEVVKVVGIPDRFAPVASLLIGVALAFFVMPTIPMVVMGGVVVGLTASGLYSGTREMTRAR